MITVKANNYTILQLSALREILHNGMVDLMSQKCVSECTECLYQWVCNDVECTIEFLNKRIAEMKAKYNNE